MSQPLVVVKTANLSDDQRSAFLYHLASLSSLRLEDAQFNFGNKVTVEVTAPQMLVHELHLQAGIPTPMSLQNSTATIRSQPNVSFDASAIAGLSPIVGSRRGGGQQASSAAARLGESAPPSRSCQWLHRLMDDIFVFQQRQYHHEASDATQPANGPVHNRNNISTTPRRSQQPHAGSPTLTHRRRSATPTVITSVLKPPATDDLTVAAFQYLSEKFGMTSMVKRHASDLLDSVRFYRTHDLDIQLFGLFLMSQAYDTTDLQMFMRWRDTLLPYTIQKQEATSSNNTTAVSRRFVRVREIPGLFRKCLVDRCEHSAQDAADNELLWHRVRAALHTWCDPLGRFPGVVPDPNFYCPPFRPTNPYVGRPPWEHPSTQVNIHNVKKHLLALEGRFQLFSSNQVVPMAQLLLVLLLSWKEERLHPSPHEVRSDPRSSATPHRSQSSATSARTKSPPPSSRTPASASRTARTRTRTPPRKVPPSAKSLQEQDRSDLYHALLSQHRTSTPPQVHQNAPMGSRSGSTFFESSLEGGSVMMHQQTSPSFPNLNPPQPQPHPHHQERSSLDATVTPQRAVKPAPQHASAVTAMTDLSPSFNPFSSPPNATTHHQDPRAAVLSPMSTHSMISSPSKARAGSANGGGGASPSLRDEEEQFYKDLLSLESRLLRAQRHKKHVSV
ncbi:Hypothetical protein, putative [Bodo saltans]|uniref:Uncharacterized protein n=1 Tax=Bodo saltans TaxID=75058 RepID=A0A0S4IX05_BODSA|nr:Hypothetical protein, putative [Bodo saltans]|eukprot:CUF85258.1 Hypothetical protein, putative [Bodo saltans]